MLKNIYLVLLPCLLLLFSTGCPQSYSKDKSSVIHNYTRCAPRMRIDNLRNASGIAFNPDSNSLFVVEDSPALIHEINFKGQILRTIELTNMNDIEAITYLGNSRFALMEESSSSIYFIYIKPDTKEIDKQSTAVLKLDVPPDNTGFEGLAYDNENQCLYAVKEKNPKKILRIFIGSEKIDSPWDLETIKIGDVSDVCLDPRTGHLLLLSHESKCIVECTTDGKELARLSLRKGQSNLKREFKKPEGIAIDPKTGRVFTCGEKDEFYIFGPQDKQ